MTFIVDCQGAESSAPIGFIEVSHDRGRPLRAVGFSSDNLGMRVTLGYVSNDNHGRDGTTATTSSQDGALALDEPAVMIEMAVPTAVIMEHLPSHAARYWDTVIRRSDMIPHGRHAETNNPWCSEVGPVELEEIPFEYSYNGELLIANGLRYKNTWAFAANLLWRGIPAEVLLAGRGIAVEGLQLEEAGPEISAELRKLPRLQYVD